MYSSENIQSQKKTFYANDCVTIGHLHFKKKLFCNLFISIFYLIEEVLDQLSDSDVIVVPVNQQHLLQMFELGNCIVTVTGRLTALFTHNS